VSLTREANELIVSKVYPKFIGSQRRSRKSQQEHNNMAIVAVCLGEDISLKVTGGRCIRLTRKGTGAPWSKGKC
jgi:hypothetical protein